MIINSQAINYKKVLFLHLSFYENIFEENITGKLMEKVKAELWLLSFNQVKSILIP